MVKGSNSIGTSAKFYIMGFGCVTIWVFISLVGLNLDMHNAICSINPNQLNIFFRYLWGLLLYLPTLGPQILYGCVSPTNKWFSNYCSFFISEHF